jgi:MoaA/NifB/PqqE/SkfB family radical SAM enzyme
MSDSPAFLTGAPKWVVLQLTEKCNLRCSMCYEWGRTGSYHRQDHSAQLELATALKVIRDLAPHRPYWGLFGGEPLLYPRLADVLTEIQSAGSSLDIPTNGLLVAEYAELLVENGVSRLWISLDGPPEVNDRQRGAGVYQRVTAGMEKLFEARKRRDRSFPKIGVTFLVTPFNYLSLESFFFEFLDLRLIEHISVEFQNYTTPGQLREYGGTWVNRKGYRKQ